VGSTLTKAMRLPGDHGQGEKASTMVGGRARDRWHGGGCTGMREEVGAAADEVDAGLGCGEGQSKGAGRGERMPPRRRGGRAPGPRVGKKEEAAIACGSGEGVVMVAAGRRRSS
jgi:hypothetical protein